MWRITLKSLLAHKLRLALTAIAIVLGVTFVSGTYILTDTIHNTFTSLFSTVYQGFNFQVRGVAQFSNAGTAVRNPIPESILPEIQKVPGVEDAAGSVVGYAQFVSHGGKAIANNGAPTIGASLHSKTLSYLHIVEGRAPTTSHGVVMDAGTAKKYHFKVGQQVRVLLLGPPRTFTITGIARFGDTANLAGATMAAFDTPTAQKVLGEVGKFNAIYVKAASGASNAAVQRDIARILPRGVDVVTRQVVVNEAISSINQPLSFLSTTLLIFAFIALFVGAFTILNTFSVVVGQRTRELALLRIVGASRRQVFRSVLGEAAILGLVSSLVGLGLGVLTAMGIEALLRGFGISMPSGSPVLAARTIIVALVLGVGVTILAAVSPARRAVRIPPVAAISDSHVADVSLRRRFTWGTSIAIAGVAVLGIGLSNHTIQLVGLGALGVFIGVAMLLPAVASPLSSAIGRPLARTLGTAGRLGRANSMRSPRRTAQTASALMIGLAVVSAFAVIGASISKSVTSVADNAVNADLIVYDKVSSPMSPGFSTTVPKVVAALPGVTMTDTIYGNTPMSGQFKFRHSLGTLTAVSARHLAGTVRLHMTAGDSRALASGAMLIDATVAKSNHLSVGDTVPVRFALTGRSTVRIGGVYKLNPIVGSYLVSDSYYLSHFQNPLPSAVLLRTSGGSSVEGEVQQALAPYPNVQVQNRAQLEHSQLAQIDKLLGLVYALLGLAVIIALIGIVNTLVLSVFERTREIGLLRAVGMKRRQVRMMIRAESVILSIFGAVVGIIIGTGLGVALASSLGSAGITAISVPVSSMVVFLILSAVLGLLAATWPARRAAKLDVLAAIAEE